MNKNTQLTVFGEEPESAYPSAPPRSRQAFKDYLEAPLRHPFYFLIPFGVVLSLAVTASFMLPRSYRSATLILVESEKMPDSFVPRMSTETTNKRLFTIKQEILSRTRLERVIEETNPFPGGGGSLTAAVESMRGAIDINVRGNDAFTIEFVHEDPKKAQQVTARLANLFIEESAKAREQQVEEAYEFLDSEVREARRELEIKDSALRQYKEQHMGNLPEQTQANLATLQMLQQEHQSLELNIRDARQRYDLLEKSLTEPRATAATGLTGSLEATTDLAQLRSQLVSLRGRYTEQHPDVQALQARISRLEKQLADAASGNLSAVDPSAAGQRVQLAKARNEIKDLESKRADLDQRIATFRSRVEQAPRMEQDLANLTRDYQKLNEIYLTLLNKKLDAQMAAKLEKRWRGDHFTILDPAHLPERPFSPNRPLLWSAGMVLGLLLGIGASLALEFLDRSVKDIDDLQNLVPYPILATIPYVAQVEAASRVALADR